MQNFINERNYRSTKSIVIPANIFIKQNKGRYEKNMYTENEEARPWYSSM